MKALRIALTALSAILSFAHGSAAGQLLGEAPGPVLEARRDARPQIALVIDDLGLDWSKLGAVNLLPVPVTLAFLPYGAEAQSMLNSADKRHETILHLPLEPHRRKHHAGPTMVRVGAPAAVQSGVKDNLRRLSGYKGVNSHTGSKLTADADAMGAVLETLAAEGLWFLDSRTAPNSKARALAGPSGAVVIEADLFLDGGFGRLGEAHVTAQLDALLREARQQGSAIGIGHPYPATLSALARWTLAHREEVRFVTAGVLAQEKKRQSESAGY